jgi:hypothetical protein
LASTWLVVAHLTFCGAYCDPLGGHADGGLLKRFADSAGVPLPLALAVAAVESGYRGGNEWRGSTGEVGRMQIQPRLWQSAFRRECGSGPVTDYQTNVCKGMFILRYWHGRTGSWLGAIRRYNGRGVAGRLYVSRVKRELRLLAELGIADPATGHLLGTGPAKRRMPVITS